MAGWDYVDMLTRVVIELKKVKGNVAESAKHQLWTERCRFHEYEAGKPRCGDGHENAANIRVSYEDSGTDESDADL